jgi:hypothetical protein
MISRPAESQKTSNRPYQKLGEKPGFYQNGFQRQRASSGEEAPCLRRSYLHKGGDATALLLLLWSIGITSYIYDSSNIILQKG